MSCEEVAEMAERKHSREEDGEVEDISACKRFRGLSPEAEELIHLLEDTEEEESAAEEEIVWGVMKSLQEEIVNSCCSTDSEIRTHDVDEVSYLDNELGIPCVMGSLLYQPTPYSATIGEACAGVSEIHGDFADGLWRFEDCNSDWLQDYILYDERLERDIRNCGDLHEVSEEDPTLLWKQDHSCAI
ncbi:hypothetical protein SUGI_1101000 [Cryptomeria japonica]|nr:hypothetical protein SUGI_1101000 [Cryptomeria japonica]